MTLQTLKLSQITPSENNPRKWLRGILLKENAMPYTTPYSRLYWTDLKEWLLAADIIRARRASFRKNQQRESHVSALRVSVIYDCQCQKSLHRALDLLTCFGSDFMQPCRGQRKNAPHTALIVAIKNRLKQLERQEDLDSMPDGHNSRNR